MPRAGLVQVGMVTGGAIAVVLAMMGGGEQPPPPLPKGEGGAADPLAAELERRLAADVRPLMETYCFSCHGGEKVKGDVRLDRLRTMGDVNGAAAALSMARELVHTKQMPPEGKPRPSEHERLILDQWLEAALEYVPPDAPVDPGWFTIHRLNRSEYRNTLRDLLWIDPSKMDAAERLPKDDTGYGFDNNADVLTVSPLALEQYLDAAERAVAFALGPEVKIGGDVPVSTLRATEGGSPLPGGGVHLYAAGAAEGKGVFPATGEYKVVVRAFEDKAGVEHAAMSLRIDGKEVKGGKLSVKGTRAEPQEFTLRVRVEEGARTIAAHFTNDYYKPGVADRNLGVEEITITGPLDEKTTERRRAWKELFGAARGGSEEGRAASVLTGFAERAYRRPLRQPERESLMELYRERRRLGSAFEGAVRESLCGVLVAPSFLYRSVENPPADAGDESKVYRLNGYELASRLSYFLWSSMPDDALIGLAKEGRLGDDGVLREQVKRMLVDPKADAFVENFVGQWLQLRSLATLEIDRGAFPAYTDELREDMVKEATLFFGDALRGDKSVAALLDSDYTFLNERLAAHYGVAGVKGDGFRRVPLEKEGGRGGVLTMAGVLTVTSNTTRTSPVKRGLFVLDQVLGTPPPPPPADIPPLEQAAHQAKDATLREQLAAHVANPTCAACHNRLDPIGLAFEHFDAVGRRRDSENGKPIDASGTLPDGTKLTGVGDLKGVLLAREEQFVQTLSGKVLTYAVGRGLEPFDRPAVRAIAERAKADGNRLGALVEAVVLSDTFRTCRGRGGRGGRERSDE